MLLLTVIMSRPRNEGLSSRRGGLGWLSREFGMGKGGLASSCSLILRVRFQLALSPTVFPRTGKIQNQRFGTLINQWNIMECDVT